MKDSDNKQNRLFNTIDNLDSKQRFDDQQRRGKSKAGKYGAQSCSSRNSKLDEDYENREPNALATPRRQNARPEAEHYTATERRKLRP